MEKIKMRTREKIIYKMKSYIKRDYISSCHVLIDKVLSSD